MRSAAAAADEFPWSIWAMATFQVGPLGTVKLPTSYWLPFGCGASFRSVRCPETAAYSSGRAVSMTAVGTDCARGLVERLMMPPWISPIRLSGCGAHSFRNRQPDGERGPLLPAGIEFDGAFVPYHDAAYAEQSQALPVCPVLGGEQRLKDALPVFFGDSGSGVRDDNPDPAAALFELHADGDAGGVLGGALAAFLRDCFDGVVQQTIETVAKQFPVAEDESGRLVGLKRNVLVGQLAGVFGNYIGHE